MTHFSKLIIKSLCGLMVVFLISGCALVSFRETSQETYPEKTQNLKVSRSNSILLVYGAINFPIDGNLSKVSLENQNLHFEEILVKKFTDSKKFIGVRKYAKSDEGSESKYLEQIFSLKVLLIEESDSSSSFGSKLLRIISFGFYPQYVDKKLKFEIDVTNLKTKENIHLLKSHTIVVSYKAPFLVIPVNIDSHPFTIKKQAQMMADIIYPTLDSLFLDLI